METKSHGTDPGWMGWCNYIRRELHSTDTKEQVEALVIFACAVADSLTTILPTLTDEQRAAAFKAQETAITNLGFSRERIAGGELA